MSFLNVFLPVIIFISIVYYSKFAYAQDCLTAHNRYRSRHGVVPLRYSYQLEIFAQKRARELAYTDIFAHPPYLPYGENLYWRSGRKPTCQDAVDVWYNEIYQYSFAHPHYSPATGHFTQIVWASTTEMGCASSWSPYSRRVYIVCNYNPPGNVRTQFAANVPFPKYNSYKSYNRLW